MRTQETQRLKGLEVPGEYPQQRRESASTWIGWLVQWKSASLFPQPQQSYCNKPLAVAARIEVMHGPNSVGCLSSRPI